MNTPCFERWGLSLLRSQPLLTLQGRSVKDEVSKGLGNLESLAENQLLGERSLNCQFVICEGGELAGVRPQHGQVSPAKL